MVRIRAAEDDQAPAPLVRVARGQGPGRGRGRPRGASKARERAASEEPPVAPVGAQAPETPTTTTLTIRETLAQFLSMFAPIQPNGGVAVPEEEQRRLERNKKYDPPIFSGLGLEDAQVAVRHGRGFVSCPVHSVLLAASGIPAPLSPPKPYYAPPVLFWLTQKGASFRWTKECKEGFQKLKIAFTTAPILVLPLGSGSYTIYCDASRVGLGATQQKFNAVWVIVDRLTKLAHLLPVMTTYSSEQLSRIYIREIVRLHGVSVSIISDWGK
uniref:Uncharacterized protein LOC104241428 n=1 Tax=Nicotiana sylvestris TaxID=4096 RepID=A0A1U7XRG2_NICSY|nr:PREDICTED: uncharacterized protein LOC104241428 [Nicotiana sylvestris]